MKTHSQTIFYLSVEDSSFRLAENSLSIQENHSNRLLLNIGQTGNSGFRNFKNTNL